MSSEFVNNCAEGDSLQIVFFEMNHKMNTGAERIDVLQKLRLPDIVFPDDWDPKRAQQKQRECFHFICNV